VKYLALALVSLIVGAMVFGLGLIGYFAWGDKTDWYMPANIAVALYSLYENVKGEREWKNPPRARGY
jgi:hypothetical protein